ncbi:MAG: hypothetical protein HZB80_01900 [Deltaproteobacteria bacterium]|nr:hypothetical protein [Deltaproteobacteria bacterium]
MSHIASYDTQITNVDQPLLLQVMNYAAGLLGGKVTDRVSEYNNRADKKVLAAITTPKLKSGIGVEIINGKLMFVGDNYGKQEEFNRVKNKILDTYYGSALAKTLPSMGFKVAVKDTGQVVTIEASR